MEQFVGTDFRVFYTRRDAACYLSHLDINRTMQRALARSHLPVWHTLGFNPHLYLTFAMPTPLGYESDCETMDFRLMEPVDEAELCERLNACLPRGLRVTKAAPPTHRSEEIARADYQVRVCAPALNAGELETLLRDFLARESIPVNKKTKKGFREIDLKPLTELLGLEQEGENGLLVTLRLAAGEKLNINPTLVFDAFTTQNSLELDCIRVKKAFVYTDQGEIFA